MFPGLLFDPHLATRRLLGLYLGPLWRFMAQFANCVLTVPLPFLSRFLVTLVTVLLTLVVWVVLRDAFVGNGMLHG